MEEEEGTDAENEGGSGMVPLDVPFDEGIPMSIQPSSQTSSSKQLSSDVWEELEIAL